MTVKDDRPFPYTILPVFLPPSSSLHQSRKKILKCALLSRLAILVGMMLSCMLIPDLNPGDDVHKFDLRFSSMATPSSHDYNNPWKCFCLSGHSCDHTKLVHDSSMLPKENESIQDRTTQTCAATQLHEIDDWSPKWTRIVNSFYFHLLQPLTRWDAARFLTLAVNPRERYPNFLHCDDKDNAACLNYNSKYDNELEYDPFLSSEEAHAFFPLFPILIRNFANNLLLVLIPAKLLPPTFEGVIALSALISNMIFFTVAALSLHDLTYTLTMKQRCITNANGDRTNSSNTECLYIAEVSAGLLCINPASIFFSVGYSESLFAMLTFMGHALTARGYIYIAILPWFAASYARSNGTLTSIWLVLLAISKLLPSLEMFKFSATSKMRGIGNFLLYICMAVLNAIPVWYHDQTGYSNHCDASNLPFKPVWCQAYGTDKISKQTRFSLYQYVQRKHWNVGFLHYYELKQIPNFLLAAPILYLTISATTHWIGRSWKSHQKETTRTSDGSRTVIQKCYSWYNPIHVIEWAIFAFKAVTCVTTKAEQQQQNSSFDCLLCGPQMLGHYAILAALGLVGLTVAHVQVSTRLICSSCVAIYWYMAYLILNRSIQKNNKQSNKQDNDDHTIVSGSYECFKDPILFYCFIYIFLGIIMHVNWMPWT